LFGTLEAILSVTSSDHGNVFDFSIVLSRLVAVAERGDQPQIHVFDLRSFRRKKTLVSPESLSCKVRTLIAYALRL
jgi:hypothetical protein